jgi:hypothetical protein
MTMVTPLSQIGLLHHGDGGIAHYDAVTQTLIVGSTGQHVPITDVFPLPLNWCLIRWDDPAIPFVLARYSAQPH